MADEKKSADGLVPMYAPDGTARLVPSDEVHALMMRGARPGLLMMPPSGGEPMVVRFEDAEAALRSGGTLLQNNGEPYPEGEAPVVVGHNAAGEPIWGAAPPPEEESAGFLDSIKNALAGAVKGTLSALNPHMTEAEKEQYLKDGPVAKAIDDAFWPIERMVQPQIDLAHRAVEEAENGNHSDAARHAFLSLVPLLGPMATQAGDTMGKQLAEGNYSGALGTAVGNLGTVAAMEAAPAGAEAAKDYVGPRVTNLAKDFVARSGKLDKPVAPEQLSPRERYAAAKDMGADLDLAQATNSPVPNAVKWENQYSLGGRGRYETAQEANVDAIHSHVNDLLNSVARQMDPDEFGEVAKNALIDDQRRLNDEASGLYNDLDERVGDKQPNLNEIRATAQKIVNDNNQYYERNPKLLAGATKRAWEVVNDLAKNDTNTWSDLHKLRSDLLDAYRSPDFTGDRPTGWLKQMVGAVDQTMTDAELTPGLSDADRDEFRRANSLYGKMKETYDNNSSPFYWATREDPTKVAQRLRKLSPEDTYRFREAMSATGNTGPNAPNGDLSDQLRRQTAEQILNKAGNAQPDLQNFPRNWKNVKKSAARETLGPELSNKLNDLSAVARTVQFDANPSGTAKTLYPMGEVGGAVGAIPSGVAEAVMGHPVVGAVTAAAAPAKMIGDYLLSRKMNDPAFVESVMKREKPPTVDEALTSGSTHDGPFAKITDVARQVAGGDGSAVIDSARGAVDSGRPALGSLGGIALAPARAVRTLATVGATSDRNPSLKDRFVQATQERNAPEQTQGVSTPPNGGQITNTATTEPNEVHDPAKAAAEMQQLERQQQPSQSTVGVKVKTPLSEQDQKALETPAPQAKLEAPPGALYQHEDEDGNILGHVMEDGGYVPLDANNS